MSSHNLWTVGYQVQKLPESIIASVQKPFVPVRPTFSNPSSTPPFPKWLIGKQNPGQVCDVALHFRIWGKKTEAQTTHPNAAGRSSQPLGNHSSKRRASTPRRAHLRRSMGGLPHLGMHIRPDSPLNVNSLRHSRGTTLSLNGDLQANKINDLPHAAASKL
jgi:hypothetical protein